MTLSRVLSEEVSKSRQTGRRKVYPACGSGPARVTVSVYVARKFGSRTLSSLLRHISNRNERRGLALQSNIVVIGDVMFFYKIV